MNRYSSTTIGTPIRHHSKNVTSIAAPSLVTSFRMKFNPITFGGVPIGVASPPIDAANEVISINPVA